MKIFIIILICFLNLFKCVGQNDKSIIIKFRPVYSAIMQGPIVYSEFLISNHLSITVEGMWKRMNWENKGGEWSFGKLYKSNGISIGLIPKKYFIKNHSIPFAWYGSLLLRFYVTQYKNIDKVDFKGHYERTVNIDKKGFEYGILFGRQFKITERIISDISFGFGNLAQEYKEIFVSGTLPDNFVNGKHTDFKSIIRPYIFFNIGYIFLRKRNNY